MALKTPKKTIIAALTKRPPVVVVLGHVDHGKTTLLDYIRKANVAKGEAGGITQSIGAYQITHTRTDADSNTDRSGHTARTDTKKNGDSSREALPADRQVGMTDGRKITFIDTPGHQAFFNMRQRGAQVADLAILVVAVDDGVQPQTKESFKIITDAKIPFVVAINKVDKDGVSIDKVKNELTAAGILLEGFGGNVSYQPISAKTGEGVNELLDLLLLASDVEELPYKPEAPAKGIILEAKMDNRKGIAVAAIIKEGTVRVGDMISAGAVSGKIKGLENFLGQRIKEALPSDPILILGFEALPAIGTEFSVGADVKNANEMRMIQNPTAKKINVAPKTLLTSPDGVVSLILKADVSGTLEALSEVIKTVPIPTKMALNIINKSVGEISDGDIKLAISTKAMIIGFKVSATKAAENLAEIHDVHIISSEIIYELLQFVEREFENLTKKVVKGDLEILAVFGKKGATNKKDGNQQIIGGKVIEGLINNKATLSIERQGQVLGTAKIINLQQMKKDANKIETGQECGLLVEGATLIKVGDHLIAR